MTLRFASLGSGSRGNALLVASGATLILVDCGLPRREVEERLATLGLAGGDVTALLVTHEHGDHARGVVSFARRYGTPVMATHGTVASIPELAAAALVDYRRPLEVGSIRVEPYPVPHDAREPCQFVFDAAGKRLGLLTDAGHVTAHVAERLAGCDALALECNHDAETLERGSYPPSVKTRVASRFGHLSNEQAAAFLGSFEHPGLQWVMAMHVSERNNSSELLRTAFAAALDGARWSLHVATQDTVTGWVEIA